MKYEDLKLLNDTMYNLGYDMGDRQDVIELSGAMDKLSQIVAKLLMMSPEEFNQTIEEFDKEHFKNLCI